MEGHNPQVKPALRLVAQSALSLQDVDLFDDKPELDLIPQSWAAKIRTAQLRKDVPVLGLVAEQTLEVVWVRSYLDPKLRSLCHQFVAETPGGVPLLGDSVTMFHNFGW